MPPLRKTEALIPLQELDLQIHGLKVQRAEKPRQLASSEKKLAHARENVEKIRAEIKELKLEGAKRELTAKEFDERVLKLQNQSMQARKNEEFQAFQKEISGLKADKSRVEDGLLDIYMQVDERVKLEKLRVEEQKQAEAGHAAAKQQLEGEITELDREIEALHARRSGHTQGAEKEVLRVYQRVLDAKEDGVALSAAAKFETIEDEGRMTYWQCEGCSVSLTSQDVNLLLLGKEIQFCRNCSRILYLRC